MSCETSKQAAIYGEMSDASARSCSQPYMAGYKANALLRGFIAFGLRWPITCLTESSADVLPVRLRPRR
jgi:hypothetical protein